jgi:anaerobic selenocysteine-containing dehydrogenase
LSAFGSDEQKHLLASITTCQDEPVRIVLGTCHHDCPDSCGWEVTVDNGIATKMRGNSAHPFSQGELCPKVNHFLERVYSPDRVLTPLIRDGAKGSGSFRTATWDEALALIVSSVRQRVQRHGGETVLPWSSAGNQGLLQMSSLDRRFFDALGASTTHGALCGSVAKTGYAATTGSGLSTDPTTVEHSRYVILWGTNTRLTNRHLWPFVERARANGAKLVVIDPIRTVTADAADWFIQPRPGTDTALALAMLNVIIDEGLVDADFVANHVSGYDDLCRAAGEWSPSRAAEECGIDANDIVTLAREYATTTPAFIRTLIGAEHRGNGGMIFRVLACLPTVTGQWRHLGGGLSRSVGSWSGEFIDDSVFDPSKPKAVRSLPFTQLGRVLIDPLDPPVTVLFVWNGNPVITCPNAALTRRGLMRDDLFTVVSEQFLTDTAKYADVVLPATTQIEHVDVVPAWGHLNLGWNGKAIDPVGESVANTEMFRRLARAFGFDDELFGMSDDELIDLAVHDIDVDALRADGWVRLPNADRRLFADGSFGHADAKCDVSGIVYEPAIADERHPLVMLTPKQHARFLNSSYSHLPAHGPREGGPYVEMTERDASSRGLAEGDVARVANDRATVELPVRVTTRLSPGVVAVPFGWWDSATSTGISANDLTSDAPTDMGGGVAYHDTFVEVTRA